MRAFAFSGSADAKLDVFLIAQHQPSVNCRSAAGPLLEVALELATPDMVWKPELTGSAKGSLQALVHTWLMSFLEVCVMSVCC